MFNEVYGKGMEFFESKSCADTAREIAHQPEMWEKLSSYLNEVQPEIKAFMDKLEPLKNYRIVLTGAGSSGFIGSTVAGFAAQKAGVQCEAIHTTSIVTAPETCLFANTPTILISFGRSGNSPESVGAVEYAREVVKDLYEIAIVCDGTSKLAAATRGNDKGLVLVMPEGTNDKGFAMTSSVSTMMLAGFATLCHCEIDKIAADILLLADQVKKPARTLQKPQKNVPKWTWSVHGTWAAARLRPLFRKARLK